MDDLISRQAAITLPVMPKEHREYQTYNLDDAYEQGWLDLQKCIEKLPSAQPEKQRGEWIRHTRVEPVYSIDGVETWGIKCQCNKCCFTTTVVEDFGYYNFCPHCGADMRGDNNED